MTRNTKVLLIEDDRSIATGLQKAMRGSGYDVAVQTRGDTGLRHALAEAYDIVITDLRLPGTDGLELVRQLHQAKPKLPIILITAHGSTETAIEATRWGAFDYLPKPFSMIELRVRIEAILRRVALDRRPLPSLAPVRDDVHTLRFDDELCDVFHQEHWAGLTRSEYRLLETLHRNSEEVLSKAFLYQHVLQRGYAPHDRSLDMHISQIRRKLKAIGYSEYQVRTVWGKGYVLSGHDAGL